MFRRIGISLLLVLAICFCACSPRIDRKPPSVDAMSAATRGMLAEYVKAMWLSQYDLVSLCTDGADVRDREGFSSRVVLMMAKLRMMGINTVFVQLRPNADSLYPSSFFPPSPYAVGEHEGFSYDPFAILVEEAKKAEISVHAWINPLRCMAIDSPRAANRDDPIGKRIVSGSPTVHAVGGYYYLDPAYPEVRELIAAGAREILSTYEIDGLHIDDYFYPTTAASFDREAYASYQSSGGALSLADFRRANTQALVATLCETAHTCGALFGVSPGGNTERNVHELYADVHAWCRANLLDYLCPQIYFGLAHESFPFARVAREFADMVSGTDIALVIGMTLEKAANGTQKKPDPYAGTGAREWIERSDVLVRCLEQAQKIDACRGVAYFSYRLFYSPADGSEYLPTAEERSHLLPALSKAKKSEKQ